MLFYMASVETNIKANVYYNSLNKIKWHIARLVMNVRKNLKKKWRFELRKKVYEHQENDFSCKRMQKKTFGFFEKNQDSQAYSYV